MVYVFVWRVREFVLSVCDELFFVVYVSVCFMCLCVVCLCVVNVCG